MATKRFKLAMVTAGLYLLAVGVLLTSYVMRPRYGNMAATPGPIVQPFWAFVAVAATVLCGLCLVIPVLGAVLARRDDGRPEWSRLFLVMAALLLTFNVWQLWYSQFGPVR